MVTDGYLHKMDDKKKETILFVDDEESILDIANEYFLQKGYQVITAENGIQAVEILKKERIDCCFTDINMPEMDGIELAEHIRKKDNTIPVIIMTGFPSLDNSIRTLKNGVVDFLVKPVSLSQMELCVRRVLRERGLFTENIILKQEVEKKKQLERLTLELGSKNEELRILNKIMSEFPLISTSAGVFDQLTNMTIEMTQADESRFYVISDIVGTPFEVAISLADHPASDSRCGKRETAEKLLMEAVSDEMPILISENRDSRHLPAEILSFMAVPMTIRGNVFGALAASVYAGEHRFTEKSLYYLSFMTNKAAYAIENLALYENIYENLFNMLLVLVKVLEAKDADTGQHSERVTNIALVTAKAMGCGAEELDILKVAGRLHDIGKVGIKDEILQKPGALTDTEFEKIREHSVIGADIVGQLGLWDKEQQIIRHHHERFDGTGYPDGLKAEKIPFLARILSIADAYDAMAYDRVYRKKIDVAHIMERIVRGAGTQFDPIVTQVFQKLHTEGEICGRGERI